MPMTEFDQISIWYQCLACKVLFEYPDKLNVHKQNPKCKEYYQQLEESELNIDDDATTEPAFPVSVEGSQNIKPSSDDIPATTSTDPSNEEEPEEYKCDICKRTFTVLNQYIFHTGLHKPRSRPTSLSKIFERSFKPRSKQQRPILKAKTLKKKTDLLKDMIRNTP